MKDPQCVAFLQWCLPRLRLRWPGFRKVRRQVCRRVDRRLRELGLADESAYRRYLEQQPEEWVRLDSFCRIPISRFRRDPAVFESLSTRVLPRLARLASERGQRELSCWSAGCASGEEAYTLRILWDLLLASEHPAMSLRIVATDVDERMIERARRGCFQKSSFRELPADWLAAAFEPTDGRYAVSPAFRTDIHFLVQDMRTVLPEGTFDLVLCRNAAFTYFDAGQQREVAQGIATRLQPGGALVLGIHETLPQGVDGFTLWEGARAVYRFEGPLAPTTKPVRSD